MKRDISFGHPNKYILKKWDSKIDSKYKHKKEKQNERDSISRKIKKW